MMIFIQFKLSSLQVGSIEKGKQLNEYTAKCRMVELTKIAMMVIPGTKPCCRTRSGGGNIGHSRCRTIESHIENDRSNHKASGRIRKRLSHDNTSARNGICICCILKMPQLTGYKALTGFK